MKPMKYIIIFLLAFAATNAHAQEPATKWSNFNAQIVEGTDGKGTPEEPYIITSAGQLAFLAVMSNSTNPAENAYRNGLFGTISAPAVIAPDTPGTYILQIDGKDDVCNSLKKSFFTEKVKKKFVVLEKDVTLWSEI